MTRKAVVLAALLLTLAGCTSGLRYKPPGFLRDPGLGPRADAARMREASAMPGAGYGEFTDPAGYVAAAHQAHLYQLQAGRIVLDRSQDRHVRLYAIRMLVRHGRLSGDLNGAAERAGLPVQPPALDAAHVELLRQLETAPDVNVEYFDQQRRVLNRARTLHAGYRANGDVRPLQGTARDSRWAANRHISQLDRLERRVLPR